MTQNGVYTLQLYASKDFDKKLFKLKIGETLRFTLAPDLTADQVVLYSDYPAKGKQYRRGSYTELPWKYSGKQAHWDPDRHVDVLIDRAGTFKFYFCKVGQPRSDALGQGFFLVDPQLHRHLDSITCQTHITKLLGPLGKWKDRLQVARESGYNMIHLTPVQHLGSSDSAYSIADQLKLDPRYLAPDYKPKIVSVSYTDATGNSQKFEIDQSFVELKECIDGLKRDWDIDMVTDVVWNHTAFDSPWLPDHPDAGYNLVNSPHLRPAYALDVALAQFSKEVAEGKWQNAGLSPYISSENDVRIIQSRLLDTVLPKARLWEYFGVDKQAIVDEFRHVVYKKQAVHGSTSSESAELRIVQDSEYRRLGSYVDRDLTLELFNIEHPHAVCFEERIERCCLELAAALENLNNDLKKRVEQEMVSAVNNLLGYIRYQFFESHGPKWGRVSKEQPLFPRYFVVVGRGPDLTWSEIEGDKGRVVLAHNGWVMNADPLKNFAEPGSQVYFQRELVVWGDSVKLRYGHEPKDNPWLWEQMIRYTKINAWLFQGFRLDNCHNTPIVVAEVLLDVARCVKSNLYVMAELFTGSEGTDNYFVNRLGIHSLIREAMFAAVPFELGRLVYRFGGAPVGSFMTPPRLAPSTAHAIFYDVTHDNDPGHILSRSVYDALPNSALVGISSCASGSTRGYDELVPHKIDVVSESRLYQEWSSDDCDKGVTKAKAVINSLHQKLAEEGYSEIFVDQVSDDVVAVTRHCPATHESVVVVAHTSFRHPPEGAFPTETRPMTSFQDVPNLTVQGHIEHIVYEARVLERQNAQPFAKCEQGHVNGMESHSLYMRKNLPLSDSLMCVYHGEEGGNTEVRFTDFCPGSVIAFKVMLFSEAARAASQMRQILGLPCPPTSTATSPAPSQNKGEELRARLKEIAGGLTLTDLNYALYRCDTEEGDDGEGGGVYDIPGHGQLVYCGLQGFISALEPIRDSNDLGHLMCDNLRAGDWMAGYTANRLKLNPGTKELGVVLSDIFSYLSAIPRYLVPCYFEAVLSTIHRVLIQTAHSKLGQFVASGSSLMRDLAMGSLQFVGHSRSAPLPPYQPLSLSPLPSMAAGLPHFTTGPMRAWGRDTFIAFRGLLLVTQRFDEARSTILSFACTVRHGLMPNLLGGGLGARFNCRDAAWWWLQAAQDYCKLAPNGPDILQEQVRKIFADNDDRGSLKEGKTVYLSDVIQEVLQSHADGISFRERGAGPGLDHDMSPPGFNVTAGVDMATGFPYGGSVHNCGTWMDKMGGSSWAGNKGVPATPRDGSSVEIVGLCKSAVRWLARLYGKGLYPYSGVMFPQDSSSAGGSSMARKPLSFAEWNKRVQQSFEAKFWVPADVEAGSQREGSESGLIHRRGIYKDTYGATQRYADFQLRPNFPIAMVVAPELFDPANGWTALESVRSILEGPLGIATLDPEDWTYDGNYINSVDSEQFKTARGFNYHQGPEWLWVAAFYLRARLTMSQQLKNNQKVSESVDFVYKKMAAHLKVLTQSPWRSLPELTNKDGSDCQDGCPAQAWSMGCFLDVLFDVAKLDQSLL